MIKEMLEVAEQRHNENKRRALNQALESELRINNYWDRVKQNFPLPDLLSFFAPAWIDEHKVSRFAIYPFSPVTRIVYTIEDAQIIGIRPEYFDHEDEIWEAIEYEFEIKTEEALMLIRDWEQNRISYLLRQPPYGD